MILRKHQAAQAWAGQAWLEQMGYKDPEDLFAALTELANLPGLAYPEMGMPHHLGRARKEAQIQNAVRSALGYLRRWPGFIQFPIDSELADEDRALEVLHLRDQLRDVWSGKDQIDSAVFPVPGPLAELLSNRDSGLVATDEDEPVVLTFSALPDWRRREFVYHPQTPFQAACYLLLKNSHLAKVCANPECRSGRRYFIATKAQRQFCSKNCSRPFEKQRSLEWWNRVGKKRRELRKQQSKRRKRGKS